MGTTQGGMFSLPTIPTLEVMVTVDPVTMQKRFDPATDLTLIDPSVNSSRFAVHCKANCEWMRLNTMTEVRVIARSVARKGNKTNSGRCCRAC